MIGFNSQNLFKLPREKRFRTRQNKSIDELNESRQSGSKKNNSVIMDHLLESDRGRGGSEAEIKTEK